MQNLIFRILFAFVIICSACFKSSTLKPQSSDSQPVPPAPTRRADRFGVYNWNVNDSAFPRDGSIDLLNWGANKVAELGSRTIRIFIGTLDIQRVYDVNPPGATDLVQVAQSPAYDKLFRDPQFQTYLLTAYSAGDTGANWGDGYTDSEYATERDEIKSKLSGRDRSHGAAYCRAKTSSLNPPRGLPRRCPSICPRRIRRPFTWSTSKAWSRAKARL